VLDRPAVAIALQREGLGGDEFRPAEMAALVAS